MITEKILIFSQDIYYTWNGTAGWLPLPVAPSNQDYIDQGLDLINLSNIPESAWKELSNPVISYYTDDLNKEEIAIETETEPFTIYDEMGDSMEVLYYTDDVEKLEAELDIVANYSPLDEFEEFEVVTWTGNANREDMDLHMKALPYGQLIFAESDIEVGLLESFSIDVIDVKIIASSNQGASWKIFKEGSWVDLLPTKESVKSNGMSPEEINNLTKEQIDELLNGSNTLRFAYYLEQDDIDEEVLANSISIQTSPVATETPVLEGITFTYDELTIEGRMKELEETNAVNMAKLNFKANALMLSEKYKMHDLVIDTFEEDSMQTAEETTLYQRDKKAYLGIGAVETEIETLPGYVQYLMISAEHIGCTFEYSLDSGLTWSTAVIDQVIDVTEREGNDLIIKVELPTVASELNSLAYGWA